MCYHQIVSFDVGIRNLAYCIIIGEDMTAWDNVDIKGATNDATTTKLLELLDHIAFDVLDVSRPITVLVEDQPRRASNLMKHVQIHISAYFKILCHFQALVSVKLKQVNPKRKLTICPSSVKSKQTRRKQYKSNKQAAVTTVSEMLNGPCTITVSDELKSKFFNSKKKDDLADCLLQAISSI